MLYDNLAVLAVAGGCLQLAKNTAWRYVTGVGV